MKTIDTIIEQGIIRTIKRNFILSGLLFKMNLKEDNNFDTFAAVELKESQINLILNPKLIKEEGLGKEEVSVLLGHELLHVFLLHFARMEEIRKVFRKHNFEYDPLNPIHCQIVNIAMDYAVNNLLFSFGFDWPQMFGQIPLNDFINNKVKIDDNKIKLFKDDSIRDLTAEEILHKILESFKDMPNKGKSKGQDQGDDAKNNPENKTQGNNKDNNNAIENYKGIDDHSKMFGDNDSLTKEVEDKLKEAVKEVLTKLKEAGTQSFKFEDYISAKLKKKTDFRLPLIRAVKSAESRIRFPNSIFLPHDIVCARFKQHKKPKIIISLDVSGSIANDEIAYAAGEILKLIPNYDITILEHDTEIVGEFATQKAFVGTKIKVTGRGGTDFRSVFNHIKEKYKNSLREVAAVIFFTDCAGPWPSINTLNIPIIILKYASGKDIPAPKFAKVINYEV